MKQRIENLSAVRIMDCIKTRQMSCREVMEYFLARIERYNKTINAVILLDRETAVKKAAEADQALEDGKWWGRLHGLPMTVKDVYEVCGFEINAGTKLYKNHKVTQNADVVQRLADEGAIIIGKTNVSFFSADWQTYSEEFGITNNPWNLSRTPGGSSGAPAAAVAAGMTPVELGSDLGGSIRIPAHFCGVYSHRPTFGIASMRGHIPGDPGDLAMPDLSTPGMITGFAEDLDLMLSVIIGKPEPESLAVRIELPTDGKKSIKDYRVLAWTNDPFCPVSREIEEKCGWFLNRLEDEGVKVDRKIPDKMEMKKIYRYMRFFSGGVIATGLTLLQRFLIRMMIPFLTVLKKTRLAIEWRPYFQGALCKHRKWLILDEQRQHLKKEFGKIFDDYDILLMPIAPWTAFEHDTKRPVLFRRILVDGKHRSYLEHIPWVAPATVLGLPATAIPIGAGTSGLPIGVQAIGPAFYDRSTIGFARKVEAMLGLPKRSGLL